MKAFTHFAHIPQLADDGMIPLWEKSWKKYGWETVVLTNEDCHKADPALAVKFTHSPLIETRNPRAYSIAAMIRWIPMLKETEPCLQVDWDVVCNGLTPGMIEFRDDVPTFLAGSTCPCAVAAKPKGWRLFNSWLEFAPFSPKFDPVALAADSCDQYATSIAPNEFYYIQPGMPCKLYQEQAGWESAPMIHFPNRLVSFPRSETIKRVLPL